MGVLGAVDLLPESMPNSTALSSKSQGNPFDEISNVSVEFDFLKRVAELAEPLRRSHDDESCLTEALTAVLATLGWQGTSWQIAELLPVGSSGIDEITDLRNVLAKLGYVSGAGIRVRLRDLSPDRLPCLAIPSRGAPLVIMESADGGIQAYDCGSKNIKTLKELKPRRAVLVHEFVEIDERDTRDTISGPRWFRALMRRFRPFIKHILGLTLLSNIFALGTPLFVMAVYDSVIPTQSLHSLIYMIAGIVVLMAFDLVARRLRARMLGHAGARFSYLLSNALFERQLNLPMNVSDKTSVGTKIPRLRDVDRLREFIFGSGGAVVFELPFTLLSIPIIWWLGGMLGVIPILALVLFFAAGLLLGLLLNERTAGLAQVLSERQSLLLAAVAKMRGIKATGSQEAWAERFEKASIDSAVGAYRFAMANNLVMTVGSGLGMLIGLATLVLGVHQVLLGALSTGGLIAIMMLIWRVIAPIQSGFLSLTRFRQIKGAYTQISALLKSKTELEELGYPVSMQKVVGRIEFSGVTMRYSHESIPAGTGLKFVIEPGESVALVGPNGSGKSTVLKMMAGLYRPQIGNVLIDNYDIRQFTPNDFRKYVSYAPQVPHFFEGSIFENMRFANPLANRRDVMDALDEVGIAEVIEALPKGLDTMAVEHGRINLSYSLQIRMSLSRALLKQAPIVLLDEPIDGLDYEGDFAFMSVLNNLRMQATVIAVTHRPGHIRALDKVLLLSTGKVKYYGPSENMVDRLISHI